MARVLVLGGTSYVAQFVLQRLQRGTCKAVSAVACTFRGRPFSPLPDGFVAAECAAASQSVRVYWGVDITDSEALEKCIEDFHPTVVINCTAISSPAVCQIDPDKACSINEPRGLVEMLEKLAWQVRFVHLSTDFVYEGTQPTGKSYDEDAAVLSSELSVYGASKLRFDQFLLKCDTNLQVLILRIANVVGPSAPLFSERSAPKFMQWLHHQLFFSGATNAPLQLWSDEFRSYLYIHDLVTIMLRLLAIEDKAGTTLLNVGGVDALSRVELANRYLEACSKHNSKAVALMTREIVPTARAEVDLGYPSPLNTKLNTTRLSRLLPTFAWTPNDQFLDEISRSFSS